MNQLVIIGASGHGKVVADIAKKNGYEEILFLDDDEVIKDCGGYKVIGKSSQFIEYDCDLIVAIGNSSTREKIQNRIELEGKAIPTLVHPDATIAENVEIGKGSIVAAGAIINPGVRIGKGCIINTGASVDHDCVIGDFSHVSVGTHVAGTVNVGKHTWLGIGAIICNNVNICGNCMIGAGAVVIKNISKSGIYVGVPAKEKIQKNIMEDETR